MTVKRRTLLGGLPLLGAARARAQPMPLIGPVGVRPVNAGPLFSLSAVPPGIALDANFMIPGTLPAGVTFTRGAVGTYFDATGTMQTVSGNTPRWDYNPSTLALNGLLIEEARTNGLFPSILGGASWVAQSSTQPLGGSVTAPDGTTSTTSLISSSDGINTIRGFLGPAVITTASTAYTASVYLRKSPTNNGYVQLNSGGAAGVAYFDLTNGTAVVGADLAAGLTNKSVSITPLLNGWYRCSFTLTTTASGTTAAMYIGPCTTVSGTGDNRNYVGVVGQGIYAWGAQVEAGAFPTSYIPTTGAAVTRAQDWCYIPPANTGFFVSPGGSWAVEFIVLSPAGNRRIISDPTGSGKVSPLYVNAAGSVVEQWAGSAVMDTTNAVTLRAISKAATTFTAGSGSNCLNAGTVTSGTLTGSGYGALATDGIGFLFVNTPGNTENTTGYIRRARYWPRVLTNTELQQVTT